MPYQVKPTGDGRFQLYNLDKKTLLRVKYKTKQSAINQGKNYIRYRKGIPIVKGNKILHK